MTAPVIIDMLWDALEMLAVQRRGDLHRIRPVRMKQDGTVAAPELFVEIFDPRISKATETWKLSEKGLEKVTP